MKDRVSITMLEDGIADVRLIRADKMNALDAAMFAGINEAIAVLAKRRACVLSCCRARAAPFVQGLI